MRDRDKQRWRGRDRSEGDRRGEGERERERARGQLRDLDGKVLGRWGGGSSVPVAEIIRDAWFGSGGKAGREGESLVGLVGGREVGRDGKVEHSEALLGKQLPLRQPLWQKRHGSLGSEDAATLMTRGRA